ncbi:hypothetical protein LUZ60_009105 [Juncus effusus]|nr:hypothetical protein LUZ60_009105 [Juncus effusus]
MATKLKGVFKGLKFISQIFVVKENSNGMEIGSPTDVKHVAHIGWESPTGPGSSCPSPSWMGDYKASTDFSSLGTVGHSRETSRETSWASQDFDQPRDISPYGIFPENNNSEVPTPAIPKPPKKQRRKKSKSKASSPSSSARSSRSSRSKDSFSSAIEDVNDIRIV